MDQRHTALRSALNNAKRFNLPAIQEAHPRRKLMTSPRICARCEKEYTPPSGFGPACSDACRQYMFRHGYRDEIWNRDNPCAHTKKFYLRDDVGNLDRWQCLDCDHTQMLET